MTPTSTRQKLSGDVVVVCHWHRDRAGALWEVELRLRPERLDALAACASGPPRTGWEDETGPRGKRRARGAGHAPGEVATTYPQDPLGITRSNHDEDFPSLDRRRAL